MAGKKNKALPKRRAPVRRPGAASEGRALLADGLGDSIAERLRAYRIGLGLTVREVASRSGVSPSMVSETERGAKTPSIAVLMALAEALGISLTRLLEKDASRGPVRVLARADHRVVVDRSGVRREHLGPTASGSRLEFVRFVLPAGTETGMLSAHHAGSIEHVHVAEGTVEVRISGEHVRAAQGDSVVFPADQAHGYANVGKGEATMYVVVEPMGPRASRGDGPPRGSHL
jgi:transcriptional regulator with XRE-family HTH domain